MALYSGLMDLWINGRGLDVTVESEPKSHDPLGMRAVHFELEHYLRASVEDAQLEIEQRGLWAMEVAA